MNEEELLKKLRVAFKMESEERLASMSSGLLELEKIPSEVARKPVLEGIFREAHSLKGAARAVNLAEIEKLCQSIESVFSALKQEKLRLSSELFDVLHNSVHAMETVLSTPEMETLSEHREEFSRLIHELESLKLNRDTETSKEFLQTDKMPGVQAEIEPDALCFQSDTEPDEISEAFDMRIDEIPLQTDTETSSTESAYDLAHSQSLLEEDRYTDEGECKVSLPENPEAALTMENAYIRHPVLEGEYSESLFVNETGESKARYSQSARFNKPLISETVRISVSKLDSLLLEAEEFASLKLVSSQRLHNLRKILSGFETWKREWSKTESEYRTLRTQVRKQDSQSVEKRAGQKISALSSILDFTEWNQVQIQDMGRAIRSLIKNAEQEHRTLSRMADELLDDMKKVMMLPFSTLFDLFPRMVRDLSKCQDKEAELILQGSDIEIDRRILENMKDPLIHLLRNAVDHGLEETEERIKLNKPRRGVIRLSVSQTESNKVEISLSDDGRGVDFTRIKEEAVKTRLISEEDAHHLKYQDAVSFIFRSGFSSSKIITEISGRGLGLAIVQERVESLGGFLSVETEPGRGTSFRIQLPVTLATFRGVLIRVSDRLFIVPGLYMERLLRIRADKVKTVENRATITFDNQVIPLAELAYILNLENQNPLSKKGVQTPLVKYITVMILGTGQKRVAFRIDEVICEQEVLVKSLGKQLARVANIAGATILGTGKVVPILNVHDLIKVSSGESFKVFSDREKSEKTDKAVAESKKNVLIVEDSITSRMLIKSILESSGYAVKTAVDGRDAYSLLKTEVFDVVVSDVEMPRMNGFELTEKIRNDPKIAELPVILVTSLDSREDRERGIDVGADAYIVKSSFDQSNLLDVIARLI